MIAKQAIWVALGLVGSAFLFSYVYLTFSKDEMVVTVSQDQAVMPQTKIIPPPKTPATPDTAADDLIDDALADRDNLDAEVKGELSNLEADTASVNSLNDAYDANETQ